MLVFVAIISALCLLYGIIGVFATARPETSLGGSPVIRLRVHCAGMLVLAAIAGGNTALYVLVRTPTSARSAAIALAITTLIWAYLLRMRTEVRLDQRGIFLVYHMLPWQRTPDPQRPVWWVRSWLLPWAEVESVQVSNFRIQTQLRERRFWNAWRRRYVVPAIIHPTAGEAEQIQVLYEQSTRAPQHTTGA